MGSSITLSDLRSLDARDLAESLRAIPQFSDPHDEVRAVSHAAPVDVYPKPSIVPCVWDDDAGRFVKVYSHRGVELQAAGKVEPFEPKPDRDARYLPVAVAWDIHQISLDEIAALKAATPALKAIGLDQPDWRARPARLVGLAGLEEENAALRANLAEARSLLRQAVDELHAPSHPCPDASPPRCPPAGSYVIASKGESLSAAMRADKPLDPYGRRS